MPCQRCHQIRKSLGRVWRRVVSRQCSIPGCGQPPMAASLCSQHWHALPLSLRMRFWKETDYGRLRRPSQQLLDEALQALRMMQ